MQGDAIALRFCLARILALRRFARAELDLPPLDTRQDLSLAMAAVGRAAGGDINSEQAVHRARIVDAARRAIEVRDASSARNHFGGRKRSSATAALPPPKAASDPA